jgi:hypothetical protein
MPQGSTTTQEPVSWSWWSRHISVLEQAGDEATGLRPPPYFRKRL